MLLRYLVILLKGSVVGHQDKVAFGRSMKNSKNIETKILQHKIFFSTLMKTGISFYRVHDPTEIDPPTHKEFYAGMYHILCLSSSLDTRVHMNGFNCIC